MAESITTDRKVIILGIETSCDDTAAAVFLNGRIASNVVFTQTIHDQYGGIVPEVASRDHLQKMLPTVEKALNEARVNWKDLDAIAVTKGPGLLGSLIVGVTFAKGLALGLQIPLLDVHHMKAHILAHFAEPPYPSFPFLCLTVSGGHTQIVKVTDYLKYELLGTTLDDAAGEAFDKSGKLLGLGYPAGPKIDQLAQKGIAKFTFPEPKVPGLDFSFSGLKTAILYFLQNQMKENPSFIDDELPHICRSIQETIVNILTKRLIEASEWTGINTIAIAGGVSANRGLRSKLNELADLKNWSLFIPDIQYTTDNAAMIAVAGYYQYRKGVFADMNIVPEARIPL